jgi:hypothetical protein
LDLKSSFPFPAHEESKPARIITMMTIEEHLSEVLLTARIIQLHSFQSNTIDSLNKCNNHYS